MKLVIIDYGLCNLLSVYNALKHLGIQAVVTSDPSELKNADRVILPGVGAFADGMNGLRAKGLVEPIQDFIRRDRPFLGICLGMQFLMSKSYEFGAHDGLGVIPGEVVCFKSAHTQLTDGVKIPHIQWNQLQSTGRSWDKTILDGIAQGSEMYFVHSFYVVPTDPKFMLSVTEYGGHSFCSVIAKHNVYGCQFHPEKSANLGLKILDNFVNLT